MNALRIATQGLLAKPLSIASQGFLPVVEVVDFPGGGGRYYVPQELRDRFRKQRKDEDEFLMALLLNAIPGLMRRH